MNGCDICGDGTEIAIVMALDMADKKQKAIGHRCFNKMFRLDR